MKSSFAKALLLTMLVVPLFHAFGQTCDPLDPNICDTIRVGCVSVSTVVEGDSFLVPIYRWSDEPIGGWSLAFHYNSDMIEVTSISMQNSKANATFLQKSFFPDENRVLVGWADFTAFAPVPANTGGADTLFSLWVKVLPGATPQQIDLDSTFSPPSGFFRLSLKIGLLTQDALPRYVDCDPAPDIRLPVEEADASLLPTEFALSQNSPNPFNPSTKIEFALPRASKTRIEVYNIVGQKVKTLLDTYLSAGYQQVEWDGTDQRGNAVASGVYLYKMTAGDFAETKKMLLMK